MQTHLNINGEGRVLDADPRTTLLDGLRNHLNLTGAKKGCDHGQCGACTVLVNGRRVNACLTLACMHEGDAIVTIEGIAARAGAEGDPGSDLPAMTPIQQAFVRHDGFQCGYCTPGQICSAVAMIDEAEAGWPSFVSEDLAADPVLDFDEIAERMSGNLCRCAAYPNIVNAIRETIGLPTMGGQADGFTVAGGDTAGGNTGNAA